MAAPTLHGHGRIIKSSHQRCINVNVRIHREFEGWTDSDIVTLIHSAQIIVRRVSDRTIWTVSGRGFLTLPVRCSGSAYAVSCMPCRAAAIIQSLSLAIIS